MFKKVLHTVALLLVLALTRSSVFVLRKPVHANGNIPSYDVSNEYDNWELSTLATN